jgi:hypothetical protein
VVVNSSSYRSTKSNSKKSFRENLSKYHKNMLKQTILAVVIMSVAIETAIARMVE